MNTKYMLGTSPSSAGVQSRVRELKSHIPPGQKKQNIKQKQHYNKFNKDSKNDPH